MRAAAKVRMSAVHRRSRKLDHQTYIVFNKDYSSAGCFPASTAPSLATSRSKHNMFTPSVFAAPTCILMLILMGVHITHLSKPNEQYR